MLSTHGIRFLRINPIAAIVVFAISSDAHACLWDWDTLQMERRLFPGTLEVITGKFVRHSQAYYEWRIQNRIRRTKNPAEDPDLADDLAVGYSKVGQHDAAIALLNKVLEAHPDRYETLANLGTIYMLSGDLQTGKEFIDRAIVINPNAHFGREKYQSLLAEYFLTDRETPHPHSLDMQTMRPKRAVGFAKFLLTKRGLETNELKWVDKDKQKQIGAEFAAAQKGIVGMMHFANYDSPLLLEALGDLLTAWPTNQEDALQLGARAYYRIAQQSQDPAVRKEFETITENVLRGNIEYINWQEKQERKGIKETENRKEKLNADLTKELDAAKDYVTAIEADEKRWIAEGVDVDAAFAAKYYDSLDHTIKLAERQLAKERLDESLRYVAVITGLVACASVVVYGIRRLWIRIFKRNAPAAT